MPLGGHGAERVRSRGFLRYPGIDVRRARLARDGPPGIDPRRAERETRIDCSQGRFLGPFSTNPLPRLAQAPEPSLPRWSRERLFASACGLLAISVDESARQFDVKVRIDLQNLGSIQKTLSTTRRTLHREKALASDGPKG